MPVINNASDQTREVPNHLELKIGNQTIKFKYLANGAYNVVYLSEEEFAYPPNESTTTCQWVYRRIISNGSDNFYEQFDKPNRLIRIWEEINHDKPAYEFNGSWLCPYYGESEATDAKTSDELIEIFKRTGRVVADSIGNGNFLWYEGETICVDVALALNPDSPRSQRYWMAQYRAYEGYWQRNRLKLSKNQDKGLALRSRTQTIITTKALKLLSETDLTFEDEFLDLLKITGENDQQSTRAKILAHLNTKNYPEIDEFEKILDQDIDSVLSFAALQHLEKNNESPQPIINLCRAKNQNDHTLCAFLAKGYYPSMPPEPEDVEALNQLQQRQRSILTDALTELSLPWEIVDSTLKKIPTLEPAADKPSTLKPPQIPLKTDPRQTSVPPQFFSTPTENQWIKDTKQRLRDFESNCLSLQTIGNKEINTATVTAFCIHVSAEIDRHAHLDENQFTSALTNILVTQSRAHFVRSDLEIAIRLIADLFLIPLTLFTGGLALGVKYLATGHCGLFSHEPTRYEQEAFRLISLQPRPRLM